MNSTTTPDAAGAARRRTPTWAWLLALLFGVSLLLLLAVVGWVLEVGIPPLSITIDGEQLPAIQIDEFTRGQKLALAIALLVALIAAMVLLPVALLIVLVGVALTLLIGIGLPVLLVVLVAALLLSPLLLVAALVWWLWRRSARLSPAGGGAANMRA